MIIDLRKNRIFELKQNLLNTDYKIHKYTEGVLSEEEFNIIKAERQAWRNEINRLENMSDETALNENLIIEREESTENVYDNELTEEVYDEEVSLNGFDTEMIPI